MNSFVDIVWANIVALISDVNSSVTGIARRMSEVFASFLDVIRSEIINSEETIQEGVRFARITTQSYYVEKAYEYQEGDNLETLSDYPLTIGYTVIDPTKQIIKQAVTSNTSTGIFTLNVATADSNNNVVPLTEAQLTAFSAYYRNWVAYGAEVPINSNTPAIFNADKLFIRYDKTVNEENVKQAIYQGLHDLQVVRRGTSRLYINELEGYLGRLPGIVDAYFSNATVTYADTEVAPIDGSVLLAPGYFNFNPDIYDFTKGITEFEDVFRA